MCIGPVCATRSFPTSTVTAAYYGYQQNAYGTGKQAGCSTSAHSVCSGSLEAFSSRCGLSPQQALRRLPRRHVQRRARWCGERLSLHDQHQSHARRALQVLTWQRDVNSRDIARPAGRGPVRGVSEPRVMGVSPELVVCKRTRCDGVLAGNRLLAPRLQAPFSRRANAVA